jgi:hypothetical protein
MFPVRIRPIASRFFRVVVVCLLLVLFIDNRSFTHNLSHGFAQATIRCTFIVS